MKKNTSKDALISSSDDSSLTQRVSSNKSECSKHSPSHNIGKDFHNIVFLIFLYLLQGKQRHLTTTKQTIF